MCVCRGNSETASPRMPNPHRVGTSAHGLGGAEPLTVALTLARAVLAPLGWQRDMRPPRDCGKARELPFPPALDWEDIVSERSHEGRRRKLFARAKYAVLVVGGALLLTGCAPPTNLLPPTIAGVPQVGSTLTTKAGTWMWSPKSYSYQWQSCDQAGAACTNIDAADSRDYTPTSSDADHTLRVLVTAHNGFGKSTAKSEAFGPIAAAHAAPHIDTLSPDHGPKAGGTGVTIAGAGFAGASAVTFGATPATAFTVDGDNQITATTPAVPSAGTVDVTVAGPNGTSNPVVFRYDEFALADCTITWTGAAGTTSWGTPENWTGSRVPESTDHVCIPSNAPGISLPVTHSTGTTAVLSMQAEAPVRLSGGTLTLTDGTHDSFTANLRLEGNGILDGSGDVTVTSSLDWERGYVLGSGTMTVAAGATATISCVSIFCR
ncbi:MAG: IPT/TIG domain-containing protein, partial [Acidimicrobiia bacterium]|nr:IPT/TIG domain-containing protein [Acidimicrobiia bacterium]